MHAHASPRRSLLAITRVWLALLLGLLALLAAGCGPKAPPRTTFVWVVGQSEPRFDPTGPADPVRWAIERLLARGLVTEDTSGRVAEGIARAWDVTPDGLTYTFHLRPGLRFGNGRPCTSADVRLALESGLNRLDHGGYAWLLSPIVGVDRTRPGRPLPPLGIATPDERTLILRLARADPTLLHKLSIAGASMPWQSAADGWGGGVGPYRLVAREPGRRMVLVRGAGTGPDTVRIEFAEGTARVRTLLRRGAVDLLWPVPPGMLHEPLAGDYRIAQRPSRPTRRLWLVMRGDLRPTSKSEARRALAHGVNRAVVQAALGVRGAEVGPWLPGGRPLELPSHDAQAVHEWLARGRLGRSMHVAMAWAAGDAGGEVARPLQAEWAGAALDIELRSLRGQAFTAAALARGGAQLLLVAAQAPMEDAAAELAMLIEPRRGPPVGGFRTGWRTREFDRWIGPQPPETPVDVELAQQRLSEELIAMPLARLPWLWIERPGGAEVRGHARYGPGPAVAPGDGEMSHLSR